MSRRAFCIPLELPKPFPAPKCLDNDAEDVRLEGVLFNGLLPAADEVRFVGVLFNGLPAPPEAAEEEAEDEEEDEDDLEKEMIILTTSGLPLIMSVIFSTCGNRWISSANAVLNNFNIKYSSRGLEP